MKNILLALGVFIIIAGGVYYFISTQNNPDTSYQKPTESQNQTEETNTSTTTEETTVATSTPNTEKENDSISVIGKSVSGTDIKAYHFGNGSRELILIGGIHGGYSWNTALLGYELIDWLTSTPQVIPDDVTVTVIPVVNPDGLKEITGTTDKFVASSVKGTDSEKEEARFNANNVDLNRNFDCEWKTSGTWQNKTVSGGSAPFSEPESVAIRDYVTSHNPSAIITWYSSAGGVYASQCGKTTLPETLSLTNTFATASKYTPHQEFNYYEITGDMVNWFAKENIPAISVLLTKPDATELSKNQAGVEAVLKAISQ